MSLAALTSFCCVSLMPDSNITSSSCVPAPVLSMMDLSTMSLLACHCPHPSHSQHYKVTAFIITWLHNIKSSSNNTALNNSIAMWWVQWRGHLQQKSYGEESIYGSTETLLGFFKSRLTKQNYQMLWLECGTVCSRDLGCDKSRQETTRSLWNSDLETGLAFYPG